MLGIFRRDRRGVAALEYAIIGSIVGTVLVSAFTSLGSHLSTLFTTIGQKI